jgi:CheY-specific phosphatase CheX
VHPPRVHRGEALPAGQDTEALLMRFETPSGFVYVNVAQRYARESAPGEQAFSGHSQQ